MSTALGNGRNVPLEVLNDRRRRAVKLRLAGMKVAEVATQVDLSVPTVIAAHNAYRTGGWGAVAVKPRGREPGSSRTLAADNERDLFSTVCGHLPDELGIGPALWDEEAVARLLKKRFRHSLHPRTLTRYLSRWGFKVPLSRARVPESTTASPQLGNELARIVARARTSGAEVYWCEAVPLRPEFARTPGKDSSVSEHLLVAMTGRGKARWMVSPRLPDAAKLVDFLDRLGRAAGRKILVLLRGFALERTPEVGNWLLAQAGRIEAMTLPPESPGNRSLGRPLQSEPARGAVPSPSARQVSVVNGHDAKPPREMKHQRAIPVPLSPAASTARGERRSVSRRRVSDVDDIDDARRAPPEAADSRLQSNQPPLIVKREPEIPFVKQVDLRPTTLTHLQRLEAEAIHIMREVVAETDNPVMLYSIGKDSSVMLRLAMKAFHPAKPPFPLLHIDTTWKFREMYEFRDRTAHDLGVDLIVHVNPEGLEMGINPFVHGSAIHTDIMKTQGLKQALDKYGFDAAFGGARRDEEKSRAKERIFSFRSAQHRWDPKNQRPELWKLYNARKHKGESIRVFPLSNWTELDIWQYIYMENIPIVPLYYAKKRPVVERDGQFIMVDDDRMPLREGEIPMMRKVRFRTLGCYPLTAAIDSDADTLAHIIGEMLVARTSERQGRVIDHDSAGSMEKKKQEGYF